MRSYVKSVRDSILNTEAAHLSLRRVPVFLYASPKRLIPLTLLMAPYGTTTKANVRSRIIVCRPPALQSGVPFALPFSLVFLPFQAATSHPHNHLMPVLHPTDIASFASSISTRASNESIDALQVVCAWPVSGQYGPGSRVLSVPILPLSHSPSLPLMAVYPSNANAGDSTERLGVLTFSINTY